MPISLVACRTAHETTPYTPVAAHEQRDRGEQLRQQRREPVLGEPRSKAGLERRN